ncbi:MAG: acetyl-CoA decarbonylase/synthase complex subunit delta [Clostridiales Family XIII bacterium]|jgi:acetyl-CoA decarbonylase/synthase complex subunit delta|nr:acetyl-CoA decarbonylase/synthase complex subunit delta [Clostridiales Family XIII bacterium]
MAFTKNPQVFTAKVAEVTFGTGDSAVTLGGESVFPLYAFDQEYAHPPVVGIDFSDKGPDRDIPGVAEFYKGAESLADVAKRASEAEGASFVSFTLASADPNGDDAPIEESVAKCKEVADAVTKPLVIQGTGNAEKDGQLLGKVAEALEGKNVLLLSALEDNYKGIAVGAVLAYGQKIAAESAVDINLAKQLNVMISQQGVKSESLVMQVGTATAGYGFEYVASAMERIRGAGLSQNDDMLQAPIITPLADETWGVKESIVSEEDFPEWGPAEERGIDMEITTAVACLASGSNAVILKHPASVKTVAGIIADLM